MFFAQSINQNFSVSKRFLSINTNYYYLSNVTESILSISRNFDIKICTYFEITSVYDKVYEWSAKEEKTLRFIDDMTADWRKCKTVILIN